MEVPHGTRCQQVRPCLLCKLEASGEIRRQLVAQAVLRRRGHAAPSAPGLATEALVAQLRGLLHGRPVRRCRAGAVPVDEARAPIHLIRVLAVPACRDVVEVERSRCVKLSSHAPQRVARVVGERAPHAVVGLPVRGDAALSPKADVRARDLVAAEGGFAHVGVHLAIEGAVARQLVHYAVSAHREAAAAVLNVVTTLKEGRGVVLFGDVDSQSRAEGSKQQGTVQRRWEAHHVAEGLRQKA
mmetsp:Transcript_92094/g.214041  ORF Transcript_92094/g.214041 Transcript_92094/m.214041 type:complete len:242 (+) Transcript_92094:192-917(+)